MAKRKWTEEERKAFGEKMRQAREARLLADLEAQNTPNLDEKTIEVSENEQNPSESPKMAQDANSVSIEDYNTLKAQVQELLSRQQQNQPVYPAAPVITGNSIVGTLQKFNTDPSYYPDPTERLMNEPRLARFAFKENWELEFSVKTTSYTTLDNRRVSEPQFTVQLIGVVFDDMGEKTNGRYVRKQMIFFEDPDSALEVARQNGLKVEDFQEKAFLDEMRYLRVRDWLLENFFPPTNAAKKQNKKQMVINNQVVDYYEISSVDASGVPFGNLDTKLR